MHYKPFWNWRNWGKSPIFGEEDGGWGNIHFGRDLEGRGRPEPRNTDAHANVVGTLSGGYGKGGETSEGLRVSSLSQVEGSPSLEHGGGNERLKIKVTIPLQCELF